MPRLLALTLAAFLLAAATADGKLTTYVSCGVKGAPAHECTTLDPSPAANFKDSRHKHVTYELCLERPNDLPDRCVTRTTGARGKPSRVRLASWQHATGIYTARWSVNGKVVATWGYDFMVAVY
jgi:hypothetical protein